MGGEIDVLTLLVKCGLAPSKAEARRLVQQGGVSVCGQKVGDIAAKWTCKELLRRRHHHQEGQEGLSQGHPVSICPRSRKKNTAVRF